MDVSIIIVNYKTAPSVIATVDSIYRYTKGISFEVLVADNASGEDDCQRLREDGRFRLIELPTNMGFGKANNMAAQQALGHYLLFLNPDTLLLNNAVDILASYLTEHPSVGIVGGNLFNGEGQPTHSFHRLMPGIFSELDFACHQIFRKLLFGKNAQFNHTNHPLNVAMITGADLMIRRDVFNQIGGFDEQFFMYNEDADLCLRTRKQGYQIHNVPTALITHAEGGSFSVSKNRIKRIMDGRSVYFNKHYSLFYCWLADILFTIENAMATIVYGFLKNHEKFELAKLRMEILNQQAPIIVNARFLLRRPTGVNRYAYHMVKSLSQKYPNIILVCPRWRRPTNDYDLKGIKIVHFGVFSGHLWEQLSLPFYKLFHLRSYLLSFCGLAPVLCRKQITTIHDVSFLVNPKWFSRSYYWVYRFITPRAIRASKKVITVSEFSKSEIIKYYPWVEKNKVVVIPCAVPNGFTINVTAYRDNYVLAVSSLDPRKNFSTLVEAMQLVPNVDLHIVGGISSSFASSINENTNNVHFLGYLNDQQLIEQYTHASAFIYPSWYEGFGIPPLEAMKMGCLVICSDIPVLHEISGEAPIYVQPNSAQSIADGIMKILDMSEEEVTLRIEQGMKQAEKYSWSLSCDKLINMLKSL